MNDDTEYEQLSADWRHRDSLTWQMPAVIIAVVGLLVSKGFELVSEVNTITITAIFISATAFALCLTISLTQNLYIQGKNKTKIESLYPKTERYKFTRWGSIFLLGLCLELCASLVLLLYQWTFEPLDYWMGKN